MALVGHGMGGVRFGGIVASRARRRPGGGPRARRWHSSRRRLQGRARHDATGAYLGRSRAG
uniref:Uncharacterized protein n=1 Tax=Oryza barthii TaxID=65489 RepID=A0A0D3F9H4_9ORYZ